MFVVYMHAVYVCAHVYNSGGLRLISVTFLSHSAMLLFDSVLVKPVAHWYSLFCWPGCSRKSLVFTLRGWSCRLAAMRTQHLHGFLEFERRFFCLCSKCFNHWVTPTFPMKFSVFYIIYIQIHMERICMNL